ncbi:MAG: fumarylacetoacetate hydrolase family protein, partial [Nitrospinota bacterium]
MKLVTMCTPEGGKERETVGAVLAGERVLDLAGASAAIPPDMVLFLEGGKPMLEAAAALCREAEGGGGAAHVRPLSAVRLRAPVPRPRKFLHTGVNFKAHLEEAGRKPPPQIPGAPRFSSTIVGPDEPVVYPTITEQLDAEAEIAIVIGTRCKNVPREEAFEVIAGYTLYNDIPARDIQRDEKRGGLLLGKNL